MFTSLIYQSEIVCEKQIFILRRRKFERKNVDIFSDVETNDKVYT